MEKELKELFTKINSTADFGYVDFSDINAANCLGDNALHISVRWGSIDAVKLLISQGIDINKHGEHGYTPLHVACEMGNMEIVKLLMEAGANPFARTEGDMPFTRARVSGNDNICDILSEYMRASPYRPETSSFSQHQAKLTDQIQELEDFIAKNCDKSD